MTKVFVIRINGQLVWKAMWRGEVPRIEFNSKGAALAYIDTCNHAGKLRS